MIAIDELIVGSYVLKENPNHGNRNEICKVSIKVDNSQVSLIRMRVFEDFTEIPVLKDDFRYIQPSNPVDIHLIKPCPLNIISLEEFGFESESLNEYTQTFVKHPLEIIYNIANGFEYNINGHFAKASSLHQLQNLYYTLTKNTLKLRDVEENLEKINKRFNID